MTKGVRDKKGEEREKKGGIHKGEQADRKGEMLTERRKTGGVAKMKR